MSELWIRMRRYFSTLGNKSIPPPEPAESGDSWRSLYDSFRDMQQLQRQAGDAGSRLRDVIDTLHQNSVQASIERDKLLLRVIDVLDLLEGFAMTPELEAVQDSLRGVLRRVNIHVNMPITGQSAPAGCILELRQPDLAGRKDLVVVGVLKSGYTRHNKPFRPPTLLLDAPPPPPPPPPPSPTVTCSLSSECTVLVAPVQSPAGDKSDRQMGSSDPIVGESSSANAFAVAGNPIVDASSQRAPPVPPPNTPALSEADPVSGTAARASETPEPDDLSKSTPPPKTKATMDQEPNHRRPA